MRSAYLPASRDRKSTRLNSSHLGISYAVFCLKKKKKKKTHVIRTGQERRKPTNTRVTRGVQRVGGVACRLRVSPELLRLLFFFFLFFFNDRATPKISPLPHHDPFPI